MFVLSPCRALNEIRHLMVNGHLSNLMPPKRQREIVKGILIAAWTVLPETMKVFGRNSYEK